MKTPYDYPLSLRGQQTSKMDPSRPGLWGVTLPQFMKKLINDNREQ